jgi:hypothetical protein
MFVFRVVEFFVVAVEAWFAVARSRVDTRWKCAVTVIPFWVQVAAAVITEFNVPRYTNART